MPKEKQAGAPDVDYEAAETKVDNLLAPDERLADDNDNKYASNEDTHIDSPLADTTGDKADETDKIVDDIVAHESDELLAAEDEKIAQAFTVGHTSRWSRFKSFVSRWWQNPKTSLATITGTIAVIVALGIIPTTRYFFLNLAGFRSNFAVTILDESTKLPLKNVSVSVAGRQTKTNENGMAALEHLRMGRTVLNVQRLAFAPVQRSITVGWGSNSLGTVVLTPVGAQYSFVVTDYLSGRPVEKAEASSGEASAFSDGNGRILLTLNKSDAPKFEVNIVAKTYRTDTYSVDASSTDVHSVRLVPDKKDVFISKRSGKYDVYSVDVDGKNEQLVLAGTGNENDNLALVPNDDKGLVALVSTRDKSYNTDGFLLSTLTIINLDNNEATTVTHSESIYVVDWFGSRLAYVQVAAGASAASPTRHRLMSFDYQSGENQLLASSNYFNDVSSVAGEIYYAPSSSYQKGQSANFVRTTPDGSKRRVVLNQEVWNAFRVAYKTLDLSVDRLWYQYQISSNEQARLLANPPGNTPNRLYIDSPNGGKQALWVDSRDGKGVLLLHNIEDGTDHVLLSKSGLKYPVRFLNEDSVIFRVKNDQEAADYVVHIDGGQPHKIKDVSDVQGLKRWYYY